MRTNNSLKLIIVCCIFSFAGASSYAQWEINDLDHAGYQLLEVPKNNIALLGNNTTFRILTQDSSVVHEIDDTYGFIQSSYFVDEQVGYIVGGCYFTFEDCPAMTLYKTMDGAKTWERVLSPITFRGVGNILGIAPAGDNALLLLQEYEGLFKLNLLDNTVDSLALAFHSDATYYLNLEVYDNQRWLISYFQYGINNAYYYKYYYTENAGETWEELFPGSHHEDHFMAVKYLEEDTWIGSSNNGKVYLIDKQNRYEQFDPGDSALERVNSFSIVNEKIIYATSYDSEDESGAIYRSSNGGRDWELEFEIEDSSFSQIMFNSPGNGYALAANVAQLAHRQTFYTGTTPEINLTVFPNPTRSDLCIPAFETLDNVLVDIYDAAGKLIMHRSMKHGILKITNLGAGAYIARCYDEADALLGQAKFIKVK